MTREEAFKCISALCCEMIELKPGQPKELRVLKAAALTYEFMEPAV